MPRVLRNLLKFFIFLAIGLFFVWLSIKGFSPSQRRDILADIREANYWLLIPVVLLGLLSNIVRAARWKLLIRPLHYNPGLINTFFTVMIGYLTNLAIPRAGEISRCALLSRYEKIPADKLIGTMIAERSVDILSFILILLLSVFVQLEVLGDYFFHGLHRRIGLGLGHLRAWKILLLAGILLVLVLLLLGMIRFFSHTRLYRRIRVLVIRIWRGIKSIGRMKENGRFLVYTLLIWSLYLGMVWIGLSCLKATSHLGLPAALAVLSFGSAGMVIPTQGGIGSYQLIVQKVLQLFAISSRIGAAMSWILWLAQMGMYLIFGLLCLILLPIINKPNYGRSVIPDPGTKGTR